MKQYAPYEALESAWVGAREANRTLLFGAENSLVALALGLDLTGRYSAYENHARAELGQAAAAILTAHDEQALAEGPALFGIADEADLEPLADVTAQTLFIWERACRREGRDSPFADLPVEDVQATDFALPSVQMVVEVAAAALEMSNVGYGGLHSTASRNEIAKIIARRGPAYAQQWIHGDMLRQYCQELGLDADMWLTALTPYYRAQMLMNSARDPRRAFVTIVERHSLLTTDNLAAVTQWDPETVDALLTPSDRMRLAYTRTDPVAAVEVAARHYDTTMSTASLAASLHMSEAEITKLLRPALRMDIILSHKDPEAAIVRIMRLLRGPCSVTALAGHLDWPLEQARDFFTDDLRLDVILKNKRPTDALVTLARRLTTGDCSVASLAQTIGWRPADVAWIFPVSTRLAVVLRQKHPTIFMLHAARQLEEVYTLDAIVERLGWTYKRAKYLFTVKNRMDIILNYTNPWDGIMQAARNKTELARYSLPLVLTSYLSVRYSPGAAQALAQKLAEEQQKYPDRRKSFLWAVLAYPDDPVKAAARLNDFRVWKSITKGTKAPTSPSDEDLLADLTYSPERLLADANPREFLYALADAAGIRRAEINKLLAHYKNNDNEPTEGALVGVLIQLRSSLVPADTNDNQDSGR